MAKEFMFTGVGTRQFTIDPVGGRASVVSFFQGNDIPNPFAPGTFLSTDRTVTVLSVVPEPSSLVLLGFGALGMLGCLRKRTMKKYCS